jgi:hypothetical protein
MAHALGARPLSEDSLRDMIEQLRALALQQPQIELLLGVEVVVQDRSRDAGGRGDFADARAVVAA